MSPSPPRAILVAFLVMVGPFAFISGSLGAEARSFRLGPGASACSGACDHRASDCVDACEATQKDDKARIECKLVCVSEREKCEKSCGADAR